MKKLLPLTALTALCASGCLDIEELFVPNRATLNETIEVSARLKSEDKDTVTPGFCVHIPSDWITENLTYDAKVNNEEIKGVATFDSTKSSDIEAWSKFSYPGSEWRCFSVPSIEVSTSSEVDIRLPIKVTRRTGAVLGFQTNAFFYSELVTRSFLQPEPLLKHSVSNSFSSVTWGSGKFVAVVDNGQAVQSSDGKEWSNVPLPGERLTFDRIHYAAGLFIAFVIDEAGLYNVWESSDLKNWKLVVENQWYFGAISDGETIVLLGTFGELATRSPQEDWAFSTTTPPLDWHFGASGGGQFLIGNPSGKLLYSSEGSTWSQPTSLPSNIQGIAYGNEKFIILAENTLHYSTAAAGPYTQIDHGDEKFDKLFFAGGKFWIDDRFSSDDGLELTPVIMPESIDMAADGDNMVVASAEGLFRIAGSRPVLDKNSHEFTVTKNGQTARKQFAVLNSGTEPIEVRQLSMATSQEFRFENDECSNSWIEPESACNFDVIFAPQAEGNYSTSISIPTSWPKNVTLAAEVSGNFTVIANPDPGTGESQAPTAPALLSPKDGAVGLGTTVDFRWEASRAPEGEAVSYKLLVCEDEAMEDCMTESVTAAAPLSDMLPGMLAFPAVMLGMVLLRRRKEGVLALLLLSAIFLPACGGSESGKAAKTKKPDAPGSLEGIGKTVTGLKEGTTYWWKVQAVGSQGNTADSAVRKFHTR